MKTKLERKLDAEHANWKLHGSGEALPQSEQPQSDERESGGGRSDRDRQQRLSAERHYEYLVSSGNLIPEQAEEAKCNLQGKLGSDARYARYLASIAPRA